MRSKGGPFVGSAYRGPLEWPREQGLNPGGGPMQGRQVKGWGYGNGQLRGLVCGGAGRVPLPLGASKARQQQHCRWLLDTARARAFTLREALQGRNTQHERCERGK